jgi:hypothetical protein
MRVAARWFRFSVAFTVFLVLGAPGGGRAFANQTGNPGSTSTSSTGGSRARLPLPRTWLVSARPAAVPASRRKRVCVVAVQPIAGHAGQTVRGAVTRIMREHGYRTLTSLPAYEGTGQYPGLAREHNVRAFVTADLEERSNRSALTFLIWSGASGSVVGRWSVAAPRPELVSAIGRGFWRNLGSAVARAKAPPSSELDEAPPVRIDAEVEEGGGQTSVVSRN